MTVQLTTCPQSTDPLPFPKWTKLDRTCPPTNIIRQLRFRHSVRAGTLSIALTPQCPKKPGTLKRTHSQQMVPQQLVFSLSKYSNNFSACN
jgi:hypothetical protein